MISGLNGHLFRLLLLAATLTSTAACGPKRVMVNGVEMPYDEGARLVYQQGKDARGQGDRATAKARFQEVVDLFPESAEVPSALSDLAALLYDEGGCQASRMVDEKLAERFPTHAGARVAKERLAACDGTVVAKNDQLSTFRTKFQEASTPAVKKEVASAAADAAVLAGDYTQAVRWLLEVLKAEAGSAEKEAIKSEVVELIDGRVSFQGIRELLEGTSGNDFPKELLTYKLGRVQYHTRDLANSTETLNQYLATWPSGTYAAGAKKLLERIAARGNVKPRVIGVLLPLSGKHKSYGDPALQAIQLALGMDDKGKGGASGITLAIRDTKSDRVVAAQMAEELALDEGAIAILGPIFTYETEPAAYKAQQLGVPILTISASEGLTDIGNFVFRNGLTNKRQTDALVHHAMDIMGMKRFAILYPRHPYGEELVQLFWDAVEKKQGEIRGIESYATEDTTFTAQVKRLVARDLLDMRADYKKAIQECDNQPDTYRKARCKEAAVKDLKPIIDFDGLFIPDYPQSIAMISAALAFEDIIVETDARRLRTIEKTLGRQVTPVTLMGASGWNSPQVVERSGRNVENAIFTDGFFADADDKISAEFVELHKKRYNRAPRLYPEALFYDSAKILAYVIATAQPASRDAMQKALRQVHDFPGVAGKTSFLKGNDAERPVKILTIKNGNIQEVPPPEAAPKVEGQ